MSTVTNNPAVSAASFIRDAKATTSELAAQYESFRAASGNSAEFDAFVAASAPGLAATLGIGRAFTAEEIAGATALAAAKATREWVKVVGTPNEDKAQTAVRDLLAELPQPVFADVATRIGAKPFGVPDRVDYASQVCKHAKKDDRIHQLAFHLMRVAVKPTGVHVHTPSFPSKPYTSGKGEAFFKPSWLDGFVITLASRTNLQALEGSPLRAEVAELVNTSQGFYRVLTDLTLALADKTKEPPATVAKKLVDALVRTDNLREHTRTFIEA